MNASQTIHLGERPLQRRVPAVTGGLVDIDGEAFYRITDHDAMAPFLMSVASDSDHWLFVSSTGALTAGRRSPDQALLPYYTDDRIHDGHADTGPLTVLLVDRGAGRRLWEPFAQRHNGVYAVRRNLYKSTVGNQVRFEEVNLDLGLTFSYTWAPSERFGFVRSVVLTNDGPAEVVVELLDGVQNLLPAGTTRFFQEHFSTLVDGHKEAELDAGGVLGIYHLSSMPGDSAKPTEALRAAVAWSVGLPTPTVVLSTQQVERFRSGAAVQGESSVRGRRGAYLARAEFSLSAGSSRNWILGADTDLDAAAVVRLRSRVSSGDVAVAVDADVRRGTETLRAVVGSADGLQLTGDEPSVARHFSNVLFNAARGGIPADGYAVGRADFAAYLTKASRRTARRESAFVTALPERLTYPELLAAATTHGNPELERLAREFLPLTFSRRHGDPSRPWNNFAIQLKDRHGQKILDYQGNWRDIFQNWEALGYSFPEYLEGMVAKFVNCSTADGNNPYRITQTGFQYIVPDDHDHAGYWGDHQVIYLLKLLETSSLFHPGRLAGLLTRRVFTYADVPYRIRPYAELLADPRDTVIFDEAHHAEVALRAGEQGAFLLGPDGEPLRVTLAEKLLVVALAKLGSYVPGAGIWMNMQRPEWNDANNALVGYGVSMVTLCQLRRYLAYCQELFAEAGPSVEISVEVAVLFERLTSALEGFAELLERTVSDLDRRAVLDALGAAASEFRTALYDGGLSGERSEVSAARLGEFCAIALRHIDHTIRGNRRPDGLYHSYNLLRIERDGLGVRRLYEMLEGQVAVLGSGVLSTAESIALLDALRASAIYRPDQNSYLLYPDRELPRFLQKNDVPASALDRSKLLAELVARGDRRVIVRDDAGGLHFHADFQNSGGLAAALDAVAADGELAELVAADRAAVLDLYEEVFDHQSFTGRSGTLFKYEGLGCIYWHMVSKLLLGVGELLGQAPDSERLRTHYEAIRAGIGVHKTPAEHGAIPIDPYSHTPGFAGAQQPGMTGQVKEDVIGRYAELGLVVTGGRVTFRPGLVREAEFRAEAGVFTYVAPGGGVRTVEVPPGGYAFTFCQVPIVVSRGDADGLRIDAADGSSAGIDGLELDAQTSEGLFQRQGFIDCLHVRFNGR